MSINLSEKDPEYEAFMRGVTPQDFPADPVERRNAINAFMGVLVSKHPVSADLEINEKSVQVSDGAHIKIRTYVHRSREPEELFPLVFVIHGGAFMNGNLDSEELSCRKFALELRVSVVNVDYRLSPEHPFPEGLNDTYEVLKWAFRNAADFHADPSKGLVIKGLSSGANFAAVISLRARDDPELKGKLTGQMLQVPLLCDPVFHPAKYKDRFLSFEENANSQSQLDRTLATYKAPTFPHLEMSPLLNENQSGLPPTFFQVCGLDILRDEGIIYEEILRENGVKTKLVFYPGVPHGFHLTCPGIKAAAKWWVDEVEGLKWLLNQS